ncbi:MAG: imidazole glycerol phosphate synthase subunit HisH [Rhodospirillaceae bacterium]|nr:imidazole glycerol phosphate synthase subunit HisH [Rhodospirillaceae bacterium]
MIAVIDYGRGNLYSLSHALSHIGVDHAVSERPEDIRAAAAIVLPGVGAFADAMDALADRELVTPLRDAASQGIPLLGICLGMQILAAKSEEFGARDGLGIIPGLVRALPEPFTQGGIRIPNMGWRRLDKHRNDPLCKGLSDNIMTYFVHSYGFFAEDDSIVATSDVNGLAVPAIVRQEQVVGCQFHPEKSGPVGLQMLRNFFAEVGVTGTK